MLSSWFDDLMELIYLAALSVFKAWVSILLSDSSSSIILSLLLNYNTYLVFASNTVLHSRSSALNLRFYYFRRSLQELPKLLSAVSTYSLFELLFLLEVEGQCCLLDWSNRSLMGVSSLGSPTPPLIQKGITDTYSRGLMLDFAHPVLSLLLLFILNLVPEFKLFAHQFTL